MHQAGHVVGGVQGEAHLHQQTEVVGGYVGVGTADDLAFLQPLFTDGTQDTQRFHCHLGVEDVVNDSFELERVVGEGHQLGGVGTRHVEGVRELCQKVKVRSVQ